MKSIVCLNKLEETIDRLLNGRLGYKGLLDYRKIGEVSAIAVYLFAQRVCELSSYLNVVEASDWFSEPIYFKKNNLINLEALVIKVISYRRRKTKNLVTIENAIYLEL